MAANLGVQKSKIIAEILCTINYCAINIVQSLQWNRMNYEMCKFYYRRR